MDTDAVPPSSPPHATTAMNAPESPFFENTLFSPKSSSPPPLFSSDDSRESADLVNYQSPRIFKNKRKGAWWDNTESANSTPEAKKTKMTRNFDSGVYMMSDATDSSDSLLPPHKSPFGLDGTVEVDPSQPQSLSTADERENVFCQKLYGGLDKNAQFYDFSDSGFEDSHIRRIGELSSVIRNVPDPGNDLPAEGQYRSLVPELYIDLNHNRLQRLTPSLFGLQSLTTLALINNDIEELPAQIAQLPRLRELNISRNSIKWLPFEMLNMFRGDDEGRLDILGDSGIQWLYQKSYREVPASLRSFSPYSLEQLHKIVASMPDRENHVWSMRHLEIMISCAETDATLLGRNPQHDSLNEGDFPHHPTSPLLNVTSLRPGRVTHSLASYFEDAGPRYVAHSLVSYFDEAGSLIDGSAEPPCSQDEGFPIIIYTMRGAHGVPKSWFTPPDTARTKSLLTLAVHSALRHKEHEGLTISDLRHHIGDPVPAVADAILRQAERNSAGGYGEFKRCHVCKSEYVVARAEWIEWWCINFATMRSLPFKVQVCSWSCVPDTILRRPERLLSWD